MEAKLFGIPQRLNEIRKSVVTTRLETTQERVDAIDALSEQMNQEKWGVKGLTISIMPILG